MWVGSENEEEAKEEEKKVFKQRRLFTFWQFKGYSYNSPEKEMLH